MKLLSNQDGCKYFLVERKAKRNVSPSIDRVNYLSGYLLEIFFNNGKIKKVDFKNFLMKAQNPMTTKYRNLKLFKKVKIENGDLTWGKDSEMDLSAESLYKWKD
jgi:hypothetical protein